MFASYPLFCIPPSKHSVYLSSIYFQTGAYQSLDLIHTTSDETALVISFGGFFDDFSTSARSEAVKLSSSGEDEGLGILTSLSRVSDKADFLNVLGNCCRKGNEK